jgi:hypothetical protein
LNDRDNGDVNVSEDGVPELGGIEEPFRVHDEIVAHIDDVMDVTEVWVVEILTVAIDGREEGSKAIDQADCILTGVVSSFEKSGARRGNGTFDGGGLNFALGFGDDGASSSGISGLFRGGGTREMAGGYDVLEVGGVFVHPGDESFSIVEFERRHVGRACGVGFTVVECS